MVRQRRTSTRGGSRERKVGGEHNNKRINDRKMQPQPCQARQRLVSTDDDLGLGGRFAVCERASDFLRALSHGFGVVCVFGERESILLLIILCYSIGRLISMGNQSVHIF